MTKNIENSIYGFKCNKELMIADYVPDPVGTGAELETKTDMWI